MKKRPIKKLFLGLIMLLYSAAMMAQDMQVYTWDAYKTKFSVPDNFRVTKTSGEVWSGTNDTITMSIYPRKDENLDRDQMQDAVYNWAASNGVKDIGDAIQLDSDKLNGYWGVMYEGTIDGFPVATMLIIDPDYSNISLYIWVSYTKGYEDTVIKMLMSFTPN
jgi:hypothetical protein